MSELLAQPLLRGLLLAALFLFVTGIAFVLSRAFDRRLLVRQRLEETASPSTVVGRQSTLRAQATKSAWTKLVDTIETRPLYAEPHQDNAASVKLLERLGFKRVGTDDDFLVFALD